MNEQKMGQRINAGLAASGMKQKDLAKILGVTDNTISYYCKGARAPKLEQLVQIAKTLNVTTDYLLGLTDDPNIQKSAVDELGISSKSVEWIKSLGTDECDDADKNIKIFDFLLTSNRFQSFFSELCSLYYATRATKVYRNFGNNVSKIIGEYIQKTQIDFADQCWLADSLSEIYHAEFDDMIMNSDIPNDLRDYLAAINKLVQMYNVNTYGNAALTDIMNSGAFLGSGFDSDTMTDVVELHVQKLLSKLIEELKCYANSDATSLTTPPISLDAILHNNEQIEAVISKSSQ